MYCYTGRFAGVLLVFNFRYEKTADYYAGVLHPCANTENGIIIPKKACEEWMQRWNIVDPAYAEYVLSCSYACDSLMKKNRIIFHGATFLWHKKAWLFSAPSGTGKTTQLLNWKRIFGDEIVILNGDKPILELCEDGSIFFPDEVGDPVLQKDPLHDLQGLPGINLCKITFIIKELVFTKDRRHPAPSFFNFRLFREIVKRGIRIVNYI